MFVSLRQQELAAISVLFHDVTKQAYVLLLNFVSSMLVTSVFPP